LLYESLSYSREAVDQLAWWRLVTASFAHLSPAHALGNGLGLALLALGLEPVVRLPRLLAVLLAGAFATGLGIHCLTDLAWYAGMSGALWAVAGHGAYAIGREAPLAGRAMLAALALFVYLDQFRSLTWSGELLAPQAHLYGFVTGVTIAVIEARLQPGRAPRIARTGLLLRLLAPTGPGTGDMTGVRAGSPVPPSSVRRFHRASGSGS